MGRFDVLCWSVKCEILAAHCVGKDMVMEKQRFSTHSKSHGNVLIFIAFHALFMIHVMEILAVDVKHHI